MYTQKQFKMRTLQKLLSVLVALVLTVALLPTATFAAAITDPYNGDLEIYTDEQDAKRTARLALDPDEAYDLNILLIGCSYGSDTASYAVNFLKSLYPDLRIHIGRLFRGNTEIKTHYELSQSGDDGYAYLEHYYDGQGGVYRQDLFTLTTDPKYPCNMQTALDRADWDIVILQTTAGLCAVDGSYANEEINYVSALLNYVKDYLKKNNSSSDPEFVWNMVWPYPSYSTDSKFAQFNNNLYEMYSGILHNVTSDVVNANTGIDYIIPNGTSILNAIGNGLSAEDLYRDNLHLSQYTPNDERTYIGSGYYTAAITTACTLALNSDKINSIAQSTDYRFTSVTSAAEKSSKITAAIDAAALNCGISGYPAHLAPIKTSVAEALSYPFMSVNNANNFIEAATYNFKTTELASATESNIKDILAAKINAVDNVSYTGVIAEAEDITVYDFDEAAAKNQEEQTFSFTVAYENGLTSEKIRVSSSVKPDLSVSSDFINGGTVPAVTQMNFTFNMPVLNAVPANIILKEEIKGGTLYNERVYSDYKYENGVYTINFAEGDLAANTTYTLTFSTDIKTADGSALLEEKTFTFTTTTSDGWYINDNFSRYLIDQTINNGNTNSTALLPLQFATGSSFNASANRPTIANVNGRKALKVSSYSNNTDARTPDVILSCVGYRPDYIPNVTQTKIKKCEVEFDFYGDDSAVYGIYTNLFTIVKLADGKYYLCARNANYGNQLADSYSNDPAYYKNSLTPLCEISESSQNSSATHKLSFIMYSDYIRSDAFIRRAYDICLDGKKITTMVDSNGVTASGATYTSIPESGLPLTISIDKSGVNSMLYAELDSTYGKYGVRTFSTWVDKTATGEEAKVANLRIYSFKYGECPSVSSNIAPFSHDVYCDGDVLLKFPVSLNDNETLNDYKSKITVTATENDSAVAFTVDKLDSKTLKLSFRKNAYVDYQVDVSSLYALGGSWPLDTYSLTFRTEPLGFINSDSSSSFDAEACKLNINEDFELCNKSETSGIDYKLIFAVYRNNNLIYTKVCDASTTSSAETATIKIEETLTNEKFTSNDTFTYKAFVFDNLNSLVPLTLNKLGTI